MVHNFILDFIDGFFSELPLLWVELGNVDLAKCVKEWLSRLPILSRQLFSLLLTLISISFVALWIFRQHLIVSSSTICWWYDVIYIYGTCWFWRLHLNRWWLLKDVHRLLARVTTEHIMIGGSSSKNIVSIALAKLVKRVWWEEFWRLILILEIRHAAHTNWRHVLLIEVHIAHLIRKLRRSSLYWWHTTHSSWTAAKVWLLHHTWLLESSLSRQSHALRRSWHTHPHGRSLRISAHCWPSKLLNLSFESFGSVEILVIDSNSFLVLKRCDFWANWLETLDAILQRFC